MIPTLDQNPMQDIVCDWCGTDAVVGFYRVINGSKFVDGRIFSFCNGCEPDEFQEEIEIVDNGEALLILSVQDVLDQ